MTRCKKSGDNLAGLVQSRRSQLTGTIVNIYRAEEAGLDPDGGPWAVVCETHGAILNRPTRKDAEYFAPYPDNWCESCAALVYEPDEQIWLPGGSSYGR